MDRGFPAGIVLSGVVPSAAGRRGARRGLARSPRAAAPVADGFAVPLPPGGGGPPAAGAGSRGRAAGDDAARPSRLRRAPGAAAQGHQAAEGRAAQGPAAAGREEDEAEAGEVRRAAAHAGPPTPGARPAAADVAPGRARVDARRRRHRRARRTRRPHRNRPARRLVPRGRCSGRSGPSGRARCKTGFTQPITVSFTILADGSLEDGSVRLVQSSGVQLLDNAAQRAVFSAAPFGPLPKTYGTNRITIQALFQPTP